MAEATGLDDLRSRLRTVLVEGETVGWADRVAPAWGHDPIANATGRTEQYRTSAGGPGSPGPPAKTSLSRRVGMAIGVVLLLPLIFDSLSMSPNYGPLGRAWRRLWGGVTTGGDNGASARRLRLRMDPFGAGTTLAVTDQRLLLLAPTTSAARPSRGGLGDALVTDVPLDTLAEVRHAPRGLLRRRVVAEFTDGSWLVLRCRDVNGFVAAVATPPQG